MKALFWVAVCAALNAGAQTPGSSRQPRVTDFWPTETTPLAEQGYFALHLNRKLTQEPRALCDVAGIRSSVPVEHVQGERREKVLRDFGVAELDPHSERPWIVLRCQTSFPDGARISLRWLNAERPVPDQAPDHDVRGGQRYNFEARSAWPFTVNCERINTEAGCNPLDKVNLRFVRDVDVDDLKQIELVDGRGRRYKPTAFESGQPVANAVSFGKLPAGAKLTVRWPKLAPGAGANSLWNRLGQLDEASLKAKPKVTVVMGAYPPLLKFGANFGIVEAAGGGVVPVTVRSVDDAVAGSAAQLHSLRLTRPEDMVDALRVLRRLNARDDFGSDYGRDDWDEEDPNEGEEAATPAKGRAASKFAFAFPEKKGDPYGRQGETRHIAWVKRLQGHVTQTLPRKLEPSAFEVVGVPLAEPGFYLLEGQSLALGRGLLEKDAPMYVRSAALVTDLAVHMHHSDSTVAVWVTQLSTGQPLESAQVRVLDCKARTLATGSTGPMGSVTLAMGSRGATWSCPLYVFAAQGNDLSFVQSNWQRGIEMWRFENLKNAYAPTGPTVAHVTLARNLLRGGETLYGKVAVRAMDAKGQLSYPKASTLPKTAQLVHQGSSERVNLNLVWSERGNAEFSYAIPAGAKRGAYRIEAAGGSAQLRVEDFRLPVLKSEVLSPAGVHVMKSATDTGLVAQLRLSYLSGGAAAGEAVKVAQRVLSTNIRFGEYEGFQFATGRQGTGQRASRGGEDDAAPDAEDGAAGTPDESMKLDASGEARVPLRLSKPIDSARVVLTEMEYRDPNGETYRAQGRTQVWPSEIALGVKLDYWTSGTAKRAEYMAVNPQGKPVAGVEIEVKGGFSGYVVHRYKTVGGYYGYRSENIEAALEPVCKGKTDAKGLFVCQFTPQYKDYDSGAYDLVAQAQDGRGRPAAVAASTYVYGGDEVWFSQAEHDRMDVLSEKKSYEVGETATLQVRSPFRQATAWVSVMRNGRVVDTLVLPVQGKQPTITLPIKPDYAPNVFVNVMAVRGRANQPAPTALVDLGRPAFKLGLVAIDVKSQRHTLKVAVQTDKKSYQSRDVGQIRLKVSAADGSAPSAQSEAAVFVLDEALLELLPNPTWDAIKTMMAPRGYGFQSASASMQVIGKRHYGRKALPAGGGGGKSATRELFETLLLWKGVVRLNAQGEAVVPMKVNDSLTRFRVVVVADADADKFGMGSTSFVATKDIQLLSGLPATVRERDEYQAMFTLRNTMDQPLSATVHAQAGAVNLPAQNVTIAAQSSQQVVWSAKAPTAAGEWVWNVKVEAKTAGGEVRSDALRIKQSVDSSLMPIRVEHLMREIKPEEGRTPLKLMLPEAAVPGRGALNVSLSPAYGTDAAGVRNYMQSYPFYCLEQRTSKAVSLRDKALWAIISDRIDDYISDSGLVNYYSDQNGYDQGYDVLTSFVLSASHEAGWKLPAAAQEKMLGGLRAFVQGKIERRFDYYASDSHALTERKLLALEALSRHEKIPQSLADSLALDDVKDLPKLSNRAVIEWLDVLHRVDWPKRSEWRAKALAELNKRIEMRDGGWWLKPRDSDNRWYYMYSSTVSQVRLALLAVDSPELREKSAALVRAALAIQKGRGHWWETQANVWGSLMLDKRSLQAKGGLHGKTTLAFNGSVHTHDWDAHPEGNVFALGLESAKGRELSLDVQHVGSGSPFLSAQSSLLADWSELTESQWKDAWIQRETRALKQQRPGTLSAGDVLEVKLKFRIHKATGWVVVSDPIPPGATVLGGGLRGQDTVAAGKASTKPTTGYWRQAGPSYVERSFTAVRVYYEYPGADETEYVYQLRVNNPGRFVLPPTQVEAMYDAAVYARRPNAPLVVK